MRLYLVRHGESENNAAKRWTGHMDVALTEMGIEDAKKARAFLSNVKFDKVYSSDLQRAVCTAKTALPDCAEIETTALLREIDVGALAGQTVAEMNEKYGEALWENRKNGDYSPYGGEDTVQFGERISAFLKQVEGCGVETVAAFAHAGVLRRMWKLVTGADFLIDKVMCLNCAVLILDYTNGMWRIHSWVNM